MVLLVVCAASYAQSAWVGSYEFTESGGKTAGGTAIVITHEIDVSEGENGLIAMIQSNGYQTSRELVCTARVEWGKLNIYFENYGENNMFEPYEQGDLLLSFVYKTAKGKTELITTWGKFMPVISKNEVSGKVYFRKTQ
jgi:hypothetical protein